MSGRLTSLVVIRQFFTPALNSTLVTLVSKKTGTRFTYVIKRKEPNADGQADEVWFVDLLNGPDNRKDFAPLAVLVMRRGLLSYYHARKSRIGATAPSAVAFKWVLEHVVVRGSEQALTQIEAWHEGACGRCGRRLSVPSSVELGLGPECAEKVGR